jgi:hypothetical protein
MRSAHAYLTAVEFADRLGVRPELFSRPSRPGVFNSSTLDRISRSTGLPAWLIVQAIETGRMIDLAAALPVGRETP